MRVAVASDDGETVSEHYGRARYYVVLAVEGNQVRSSETRPKGGHRTFASRQYPEPTRVGRHGYGRGSQSRHKTMAQTIADCDGLIAGGMGWGAFESLRSCGIEPVLTDVRDIREAALRFAQGELPNLMERLH